MDTLCRNILVELAGYLFQVSRSLISNGDEIKNPCG